MPTTFIRTVLGDISPGSLGVCLPHEHLLGQPPEGMATDDLTLDSLDAALTELGLYREAGGRSVVEMTTPDYGRDPAGMRLLSERSGVHIVAATGFNKEKFSDPFLEAAVEELAERCIRDIQDGMDGSRVPAGLVKAASTLNEISRKAEKMFHAAALAHLETGAPVSTHTEAGTMALEQIDLLVGDGVDPAHIIIGHLDRKLEWDYHLEIARRGVFLGYDQIAKEQYAPDRVRVEFIVRLVDAGHGQQILLSGDMARRSYWRAYSADGAPGLAYILEKFVPMLVRAGLSPEQVTDMVVANPARAFSFSSP